MTQVPQVGIRAVAQGMQKNRVGASWNPISFISLEPQAPGSRDFYTLVFVGEREVSEMLIVPWQSIRKILEILNKNLAPEPRSSTKPILRESSLVGCVSGWC